MIFGGLSYVAVFDAHVLTGAISDIVANASGDINE